MSRVLDYVYFVVFRAIKTFILCMTLNALARVDEERSVREQATARITTETS
jgi:hypothetical protein